MYRVTTTGWTIRTDDATSIADRLNAKGPDRKGWWTAKCPFHDDRSPSFRFTVHGFVCFGCGKTGHINEVAEHLGLRDRYGFR